MTKEEYTDKIEQVKKEIQDNHNDFSVINDDTVVTYAVLKVIQKQQMLERRLRYYEAMLSNLDLV